MNETSLEISRADIPQSLQRVSAEDFMPVFSVIGVGFSFLRRLQHGEVQVYIAYIFITLFLLMLWVR